MMKMMAADHHNPKTSLESIFFKEVDDMIVNRLQKEADTPEGRDSLIRYTGLHDETLIEELVHLGVTPEGLIAMRLVPLVLVAWANHRVDLAERATVLREAHKSGVGKDSVADVLLKHWLETKPTDELMDAWIRYMHGQFQSMSSQAKKKLIKSTVRQMKAVARASGGHLGFGGISESEQRVIERIETEYHNLFTDGQ